MASREYDDEGFERLCSDEPDYEAIMERRAEARREAAEERAERSYDRHMQGY